MDVGTIVVDCTTLDKHSDKVELRLFDGTLSRVIWLS